MNNERQPSNRKYGFNPGRQSDQGTIIERQPLIAGAIGLAIGAALGAAIPSTDTENRMMGDKADELKRRAGELATEQYENVKETAGRLYEDVRDEVATPSAAPGVAASAGNAVKDSVDGALGDSRGEKNLPLGASKAPFPPAGKTGAAKMG